MSGLRRIVIDSGQRRSDDVIEAGREYRDQIVAAERERCAEICADVMRRHRAEMQRLDSPESQYEGHDEEYWLAKAAHDAAAECARLIRDSSSNDSGR